MDKSRLYVQLKIRGEILSKSVKILTHDHVVISFDLPISAHEELSYYAKLLNVNRSDIIRYGLYLVLYDNVEVALPKKGEEKTKKTTVNVGRRIWLALKQRYERYAPVVRAATLLALDMIARYINDDLPANVNAKVIKLLS